MVQTKPPKREAVWLIAHCNADGKSSVAQARITAVTQIEAQMRFKQLYPGREIRTIGIQGHE